MYFWQLSALNKCNLRFQYNIIFQPYQSFNGHSSGGAREYIRSRTSYAKFNFEQLSLEAFLEVTHIFGFHFKRAS